MICKGDTWQQLLTKKSNSSNNNNAPEIVVPFELLYDILEFLQPRRILPLLDDKRYSTMQFKNLLHVQVHLPSSDGIISLAVEDYVSVRQVRNEALR